MLIAALIAHHLRLGAYLPIILAAAATGDHPLEAHQQLLLAIRQGGMLLILQGAVAHRKNAEILRHLHVYHGLYSACPQDCTEQHKTGQPSITLHSH